MITEPFLKISKNYWSGKTLGLKIKPLTFDFFLGDITEKRRSTILASFQKICSGTKTPKKDEYIFRGSTLGYKSQADLSEKKNDKQEKVIGIVDELDAHYGFLCWKTAAVCRCCCTSWQPVHVLIIWLSQKKYDKSVCDGLYKLCNVNFDDISTHLALVVIWIIISTSAFLASAFGANDILTTLFLGNLWRCFVHWSSWEMAEFDYEQESLSM